MVEASAGVGAESVEQEGAVKVAQAAQRSVCPVVSEVRVEVVGRGNCVGAAALPPGPPRSRRRLRRFLGLGPGLLLLLVLAALLHWVVLVGVVIALVLPGRQIVGRQLQQRGGTAAETLCGSKKAGCVVAASEARCGVRGQAGSASELREDFAVERGLPNCRHGRQMQGACTCTCTAT